MFCAIIGALCAVLFLEAVLIAYVYAKMVRGKRSTYAAARELERAKNEIPPGFDELQHEQTFVRAPGGYELRVHAFPGHSRKTMVFHHGIFWNWYGICKYMEFFLDSGWNIVAFDSRGHGESGGGNPSFGFFEKYDLGAVCAWARTRFPETTLFGLYGESMGAATVLQYAEIADNFDFIVADCPFTNAYDELVHQLRRKGFPRIAIPAIARPAEALIAALEGFRLRDASPETAIMKSKVPILFAHGNGDTYVPFWMSSKMYESRKDFAPSELLQAESGRHGASAVEDRIHYRAVLDAFLESVEKGTI